MIGREYESREQVTLFGVAMFVLVLVRLWGFLFTRSVLSSIVLVYVSYISVLILFVFIVLLYGMGKTTAISLLWSPYLLLTIISLAANLNLQNLTYWFVFFVMIRRAACVDFLQSIPSRLLFWSGVIAMIGVCIQFFFLPFYNSYIADLFISPNDIVSLDDAYGMRGFSHQQGTTSIILIFGMVTTLFLKKEAVPIKLQKPVFYWALVALMLFSIFLTGKRMISLLAVFTILLYFISAANTGAARGARAVFVIAVACLSLEFVLPLLTENSDIFVLRRLGRTMSNVQGGQDIIGVRRELWDLAIDSYRKHPILGIGIGNFAKYTGAQTDTHNTYLQVLCEQGIIGFVLYVGAIVFSFLYSISLLKRNVDSESRSYIYTSLVLQFIFIVYAFTGNVNLDVDIVMYFIGVSIAVYFHSIQHP